MIQLDTVIHQCLNKIKVKNMCELCSYLPGVDKNKRMHHLTFKRMMNSDKEALIQLLHEHILCFNEPQKLGKQERKNRKKRTTIPPQDMVDLIQLALKRKDEEMFSLLYKNIPSKFLINQLQPYIEQNKKEYFVQRFLFNLLSGGSEKLSLIKA